MTPDKKADEAVRNVLNRHPAMVEEQPRAVDILMVNRTNLLSTPKPWPPLVVAMTSTTSLQWMQNNSMD